MRFLLEACVDSVESAIEAKEGGAMRLELCSNLIVGGTSPSLALYEHVREVTKMKVHVLIRPRAGDFCYSDYEFQIMEREIHMFREAGADGIVTGVLMLDGSLDIQRMKKLIQRAGHMHITLHRAFDMAKDPYKTLNEAKRLGVHTILTSGQQNHCINGIKLIKECIDLAEDKMEVLVGSGISSENIEILIKETGAYAFHMSGKRRVESQMRYRKEAVTMGSKWLNEYENWMTDREKINKVYRVLEEYVGS